MKKPGWTLKMTIRFLLPMSLIVIIGCAASGWFFYNSAVNRDAAQSISLAIADQSDPQVNEDQIIAGLIRASVIHGKVDGSGRPRNVWGNDFEVTIHSTGDVTCNSPGPMGLGGAQYTSSPLK